MAAENAVLTAIYDPKPAMNRELAAQYGAAAMNTVEDLAAADVDAVYIASPADVHFAQTLLCARAGKHVLCEKPLGLTVAEAQAMLAACREHRVQLGVGLMMRFTAQHGAARELVTSGRLGRPVFARAQLSCWYPPIPHAWRQDPARAGGGALMDLGGHCIDLLQMCFGPVRAVSCLTNCTVHAYAVEDSAVATLHFENGALGVVDTFFCLPDEASQNRLELYGSLGGILAEGTISQAAEGKMHAHLLAGAEHYDAAQARGSRRGMEIRPPVVNPYRAEIEEFSRACLEGREPLNNGRLGLESQQILAACYESAASGRVVNLGARA